MTTHQIGKQEFRSIKNKKFRFGLFLQLNFARESIDCVNNRMLYVRINQLLNTSKATCTIFSFQTTV